jgi:hypothetical protein
MRRILLFVILALIVLILVFEPEARRTIGGLYSNTVGEWFRAEPRRPASPGMQKVFTVAGGKYFHRKDCPEIEGRRAVVMPVAKARELYKPCPVCNPPR